MKMKNQKLTDDTRLLINHWPAVEDILSAERQLHTQLTEFLHLLKSDLVKCSWWSHKWHFVEEDEEQAYIAHDNWRVRKSGYALWIGVEAFRPATLFGKEVYQQLYLWSGEDKPAFVAALRKLYQTKKLLPLGDVVEKPVGYVARKFLPKSLPGQAKAFEPTMRSSILKFFSFYARQEKALSTQVARHFNSK